MSTSRSDYDASSSGISRRKTGCWTCRIRRKRCDEIADEQGNCQECVRLKIPCVGWGEKRPEWTKDEETLRKFKEDIKKQLMTRAPNRGGPPEISAGYSLPDTRDRLTNQIGGDGLLDDEGINERNMYGMQNSHMSHYPEYVHSFPTSGPQSEMFEFPGFAANLFSIAQACQLPPEYMTYVIQIAELEQWKSAQDNSGTLSYRELARRGKAIERMLLGQGVTGSTSYSPATHNIALTPSMNYAAASTSSYGIIPVPSQAAFANVVAQSSPTQLIFMDACLYMLHSVVSGPNPRVPELADAVRSITMRFASIPIHQRTVALIFPLCVAGALAENTESQYIRNQVGSLGASADLVQAVNMLIHNVSQSRRAHEYNNANPLML